MRRYALAMLPGGRDADDIVRRCLAKAIGRLHEAGDAAGMRVWLFAMMYRELPAGGDSAGGDACRHHLGIMSAQWRQRNWLARLAGCPWNSAVPCSSFLWRTFPMLRRLRSWGCPP